MAIDANNEYKKAEIELINIYQKILIEYKENRIFIRNLKASQRQWKKYRKAEIKLKFPKESSEMYGSSFSMCISFLLTKITRERIESLNKFLKREDGDVCN